MCFWKKKNRELLILFLNLIKKNKNKKEQQYIKQFQQDLNSVDSIRTQKIKKKLLFEFQTQLEKKQKFAWKEIKGKQSGWTSKWKYKLHKIDSWNKEQPSFNKYQRNSASFLSANKIPLEQIYNDVW